MCWSEGCFCIWSPRPASGCATFGAGVVGCEPLIDVSEGRAWPPLLGGSLVADFFSWVDGHDFVVREHGGGVGVGADDPGSCDVVFCFSECSEDGAAGGHGGVVEVVSVVFAVVAEGGLDCVVVDDEISASFVFFDPGGFAAAGWSLDEDDAGFVGSPFFSLVVFGAAGVAFCAGGSEVCGFPPLAALGDGGDVVDLGGVGGAAGGVDLAGVVVSFEDLFADALPGAGVGGFGHVQQNPESHPSAPISDPKRVSPAVAMVSERRVLFSAPFRVM